MSTLKNSSDIYVNRHIITKIIGTHFYCERTFLTSFTSTLHLMSTYEGHLYVRRIGLYLYKYRIYGTISIYILKCLACLSTDINFTSFALSSVKIYSFEKAWKRTLLEIHVILTTQQAGNKTLLSSIRYGDISICEDNFSFAPSKLIIQTLIVDKCSTTLSMLFALL